MHNFCVVFRLFFVLFLYRLFLHIAALFIGADDFRILSALFLQKRTAFGAFFARRLIPAHKITAVTVVLAAVINTSLLGLLNQNLAAAFGAVHACFFKIGLRILTFGKTWAG